MAKNKQMKTYFWLFGILLMLSACSEKKTISEKEVSIIPRPVEIKKEAGFFTFNENTVFIITQNKWRDVAKVLTDKFQKACNWDLLIKDVETDKNCVVFIKNDTLPKEAYNLEIDEDKITIAASSFNGFLYGIETIRQLLPKEIESKTNVNNIKWQVPALQIKDSPRFKWRGLMLDVSRHFFKKEYLLKTIDRLAFLKMNILHLHLVDDQGWRIEIKKYPKLTDLGAWRVNQEDKHWNNRANNSPQDRGNYGGFYTQKEMKEIVAYAQKKGITVVPEIEMPAHISCAIAAYPELSCQGKPIAVPSGGFWPITDIYCAGNENTFTFLEDVFTEVMALFPSKYIHIGGDEATKTNWKKCKKCKKRIHREKLKNVEELQSYFIKRIEKIINAKGKKLIGWDEILEGGLAPQATVMSWRGVKGGLEASEQGHDVIMSPGSHCYFNHYQGNPQYEPVAQGGYTPLSKVYKYEPVVETMTSEQKKHVLGAQANLWSEFITTEAHSEYMLFPRLLALSEVLWSKKSQRDWGDFSKRINILLKRLDIMAINYSQSAKKVSLSTEVAEKDKGIAVIINSEFPNEDIRYSLDDGDFATYTQPIILDKTTSIKAAIFEDDKPIGKPIEKKLIFHKGVGKKVSFSIEPSETYKGTRTTLVDIFRGSTHFRDGKWQGWNHTDTEVTLDLGEPTEISKITVGCLEDQASWIIFPEKLEIYTSIDGKKYNKVGVKKYPYRANGYVTLNDFNIKLDKQKARYIKTRIWYARHGKDSPHSWIFVDEIIVE